MDVFNTFPFEQIVSYAMATVVILTGLIAIVYAIWG